jgi:hypothetical protein
VILLESFKIKEFSLNPIFQVKKHAQSKLLALGLNSRAVSFILNQRNYVHFPVKSFVLQMKILDLKFLFLFFHLHVFS